METTVKILTLNIAPFNLTVGGALLGVNMYKHCIVDGCDKKQFVKNMCHLHYGRFKNGKVLTEKTIYDPRPAIIDGNIAKIPIGIDAKYGYAIVDKEFAWLADKHKWSLANIYDRYAVTNIGKSVVRMHRLIFGMTSYDGKNIIDHINHNTLDNRLDNLRVVTPSQSVWNTKGYGKYGYKGVTKHYNSYRAKLVINKIEHYGKCRKTIEEAAKDYNELAIKYHGEFAYLNNVKGDTEIK